MGEAAWRWATDPLAERLARIASDHTTGASDLAAAALLALAEALRRWGGVRDAEIRRRIRRAARTWGTLQPAMGFFLESAAQLTEIARRPSPVRTCVQRWLKATRAQLAREHRAVVTRASRGLPSRVGYLTISRSTVVRDTLLAFQRARRPREVLALRSLPGGEGATLVRELRAGGLRARLLEDGDLPGLRAEVGVVLLGADTVLPEGALIHKVGTRRLCRWARRRHIPIVVLAGRSKFLRRGRRGPPPGVLFDRTPGEWIREFWTDRGRLHPPARNRGTSARRSTLPTLEPM